MDRADECIKCKGEGVRSVYLGRYGGCVECDRCDGTGVDPVRGQTNA